MEKSFSNKSCTQITGSTKPYSTVEAANMMKHAVGWNLSEDSTTLLSTFEFSDFKQAIVFINIVAAMAEAENHHPNIHIHNQHYVSITLSTNSINGLSENDFIIAAKINEIVEKSQSPEINEIDE